MALTWKKLVSLGMDLPEVVEGIWFRTPALKVGDKSFVRLKEDGRTVVFLTDGVEEQEALVAALPEVYFITDHYRGYAAVLARLSKLGVTEARARLRVAWRQRAPKKLQKKHAVD